MVDSWIDYVQRIFNIRLFVIKQTPITVWSVLLFVGVLILFNLASRFFCRAVLGRIFARCHIESGTSYNLQRITHYVIMLAGALVAFQFVGVDLSGLVVVFGLLSVGIGFGLQNVTSNFVSGLILLIERPISVGDRVTIGETEGDVMEIRMRATIVRSLENIDIIVPNSEFIADRITNWSHGDAKVRIDVDVGVSYDSDLDVVLRSLREVAAECDEVLKEPPPEALHFGFGDSAWNMKLRVWIANPKRHPYVRSDLLCAIVGKFRANNVEMPFPQRDIHVRSDDTKAGGEGNAETDKK